MAIAIQGTIYGRCECGDRLMREGALDGGIRVQHGMNPEHSVVFGADIWLDAPVDSFHPRIEGWIDTVHRRLASISEEGTRPRSPSVHADRPSTSPAAVRSGGPR